MKLNDADLVSPLAFLEASLREGPIGSVLGHRIAHKFHRTPALERGRLVCRQCLGHDFDRLVFQLVAADEVFRSDDVAGGWAV